jgi:8-oxo-dGTP pyrophosphatase MutT (NUDIX family)
MKRRRRDRKKQKRPLRLQYAALPYRAIGKSQLEVMLVTSRGTRRWIIPKGWPKRGISPNATAAQEAFEEAGVIGKVRKRPIGSFPYVKLLPQGVTASCRVQVFPFRVTRQQKKWPEKRQRKRIRGRGWQMFRRRNRQTRVSTTRTRRSPRRPILHILAFGWVQGS